MFYGNWEHIALATSVDGKTFARQLTSDGGSGMFGEGNRKQHARSHGAQDRVPLLLLLHGFSESITVRISCARPRIRSTGARPGKLPMAAQKATARIRPNARSSIITRLRATTICCEINSTERKRSLPFTARVIRSISGRTDDRYLVETMPYAAPEIIESAGQTLPCHAPFRSERHPDRQIEIRGEND